MHTTQQLDPSTSSAETASAPIDVQHIVRVPAPPAVVLAHLLEDDSPTQLMWHVVDVTRVSDRAWMWQFVLSRELWWAWDCERTVSDDGTQVAWHSLALRDPRVQVAFDLHPLSAQPGGPSGEHCEVALHLTVDSDHRLGRWGIAHTQAVAEQFVQHTLHQLQSWVEHGTASNAASDALSPRALWARWLSGNLQ